MKALFSVYAISFATGRRVFYHAYATKSTAMKKARALAESGGRPCVVVKAVPFGEDLAVYEV